MKKQKTILSALSHTHIVKDGVLQLEIEKTLQVWQEVVLQIDDDDKLLEPPDDITNKGYSKKNWVLDTKLWRCGELNSSPNRCVKSESTVRSQFFGLKQVAKDMTRHHLFEFAEFRFSPQTEEGSIFSCLLHQLYTMRTHIK